MTVGELKELLDDFGDHLEVLLESEVVGTIFTFGDINTTQNSLVLDGFTYLSIGIGEEYEDTSE